MDQVLHTELDTLSSGFSSRVSTLAKRSDANARGAQQVEKVFKCERDHLDVRFKKDENDILFESDGRSGRIVFTGLPGTKTVRDRKISSKRREFIFFNPGSPVKIPAFTSPSFFNKNFILAKGFFSFNLCNRHLIE